ncbi:MAG: putative exported protein [Deltaproteobacteria bacterium]|nr:putative exported protein [Deltaproteobacteria bacterium]
MIKKYLVDILCVLVVFAGAFLIAERTGIEIPERRTPPSKEKRPDLQKEEKKGQASEIIRQTGDAEPFKEKNAFASGDGKTAAAGGKAARSSENPYSLVGVLQGGEKRAVFLEPGGKIVALAVGKNLADGSVVTRIDDLSVELEKGKEKKNLKLFDLTKQADLKASSRPDRERPSRQDAGAVQPRPQRVAPQPQQVPPQVQGQGGQQQPPRVAPGQQTPQKTERTRPQTSRERPSRGTDRQASPSQ